MNEAGTNRIMPDKCPQCGASLPAGALAGLCPACLLQQGAAADTVTGPDGKVSVPPSIEEVALHFPGLEIIELLGRGGMGAVYKARQKQLDRLVALKILPPRSGDDSAFAERFTREAKALARLNHPGIVTLYEFGKVDPQPSTTNPLSRQNEVTAGRPSYGLYYFLMEFVDGVNLRRLLAGGRIAPREALAIVPQICDALQYAHDQGIVHRDIKPDNILLDRRGRVKLADFGLAKLVESDAPLTPSLSASDAERLADRPVEGKPPVLTEAGKIMGTPRYMSPEQVQNPGAVDHRADIYALGVVFYQMLTGELPGKSLEPPSRKVEIDVRLDDVVLRALEKDPERRYQQVSEVKTSVETIVRTPEPAARAAAANQGQAPASKVKHPRETGEEGLLVEADKPRRQGLKVLGFAAAAVLALIGLGIGAVALHWFPNVKPQRGADAPMVLVKGTLTDIATDRPVVGARVMDIFLHRGPERAGQVAWTDNAGRFELRTWNEGDHSLDVSAAGYRAADWAYPVQPSGSNQVLTLAFRLQPTNWVSALTESWFPEVEPDGEPGLNPIRNEARDLKVQGKYEQALQRYLWYHSHAQEYSKSSPGFNLALVANDWIDLGRRYPKARQALLEIRDTNQNELLAGRGDQALFMEESSLNVYLGKEEATYRLFKSLEKEDPDLARQCYSLVQTLLMKRGEYDLCLQYVGDPQAAFDRHQHFWEMRKDSNRRMADLMKDSQRRMEESRRKMVAEHPEIRMPEPHRPPFPDQAKQTDDSFGDQVCQLIEILLGTKHKAEAAKIRDQAIPLLDAPRLKSAIEDAEKAVRKAAAAPKPPPVPIEIYQSARLSPGLTDTNAPVRSASAERRSPPSLDGTPAQSRPVRGSQSLAKPTPANPALDPETGLPLPAGPGSPVFKPAAIDPATGLPLSAGATGTQFRINPATGLLVPVGTNSLGVTRHPRP
jgi:hypothetical protein